MLLTLAVTKFSEGAWIVVVVTPLLVGAFLLVRRHYEDVAADLSLEGLPRLPEWRHTVLVLVGDVHRGVVRAVHYAKTLGPEATVRAVFVETDPARTARVEEKWARWGLGVPLVVLTSPYRSLLRPVLEYVDKIRTRGRSDGHHRPPRVPSPALVAAHAAQPDGAAREGRAPVPPEHRGCRHPVPAPR